MISDHLHSSSMRPRKLISAEARVPPNTKHFARTTLRAFRTMNQEKMQSVGFVTFDLLSLDGTYLEGSTLYSMRQRYEVILQLHGLA